MNATVQPEMQNSEHGIAVYFDGNRAWEQVDILDGDEVLRTIIRLFRTIGNMRNSARFG